MRIAKPLLLVTTPIGIAGGLHEAHRLAGGLVVLFIALILMISVALGTVVFTIRRERAEEAAKRAALQTSAGDIHPASRGLNA